MIINFKKEINENVLKCLNLNKYLRETVPLHLQLCEIKLENIFKKKSIVVTANVPIQDYFKQTMKNLYLKLPQNEQNN